MKHAPRGPIKARPHVPIDPCRTCGRQHPRGCRGHRRDGAPCGQPAMRGGVVCRKHGGKAPQVLRKSAERLDALKPLAIRYYDWLLGQQEYPSAGLGAANAVLDRVDGKAAETVRVIETTDRQIAELKAAQRANAEAAKRRK